jgi:hypothetical protein
LKLFYFYCGQKRTELGNKTPASNHPFLMLDFPPWDEVIGLYSLRPLCALAVGEGNVLLFFSLVSLTWSRCKIHETRHGVSCKPRLEQMELREVLVPWLLLTLPHLLAAVQPSQWRTVDYERFWIILNQL